MDGRTRVRHAIERKPLDRIPRFDSPWEDTVVAWEAQGCPKGVDLGDLFDWDIVTLGLDLSMRQEQKLISEDDEFRTVQDRFGCTIRKAIGVSRTVECTDHATKDKETWQALRPRFRFDPNDTARVDDASYFLHMDEYPTWDEARAKYERVRAKGKYLLFHGYGPWEGTWRHRGYTELMMDIAADPDWAHDMGEAIMDLLIACLDHCVKLDMKPDAMYLIDDLAYCRGLLFSPDAWRRLFKPLYVKLGRFLHANGIGFWVHCCGNFEALLPDFIDCGVDVVQPLQAHSGMDVRTLKPLYGDKLTFWGNIDARKMSGPADALEAEMRDKLTMAKQGGGYMYHSDHSVPPDVSFERFKWIMALTEKYGRYD